MNFGICHTCNKQIIPDKDGWIPAYSYYCGDMCWDCFNKMRENRDGKK